MNDNYSSHTRKETKTMAVLAPAKRTEGGTGQTTASPAVVAGGGIVPFTRASNRHMEPLGPAVAYAIPGAAQINPTSILAYGYLRDILAKVNIVATGGTPSFAADGPWNLFGNIQIKEPNGNPIYTTDGYGLYLANKYGGYRGFNDPKQWYGYVGTATNATFWLRIPLEITLREALGSLPNQANNAAFQLTATLNPIATVYSATTPPTSLVVTVTLFQEEWDQPAPDTNGQANETAPPAVNTTQFWTQTNKILALGGYNEVQLSRVGNLVRTLIFVTRTSAGARSASLMPQLTNLELDNAVLSILDRDAWLLQMSEAYGYTGTLDAAGGLDTGVYVLPYTDDFSGKPGFETRNLYLPTQTQSRLSLKGQFGSSGTGSMDVYTNDIIPAAPIRVG